MAVVAAARSRAWLLEALPSELKAPQQKSGHGSKVQETNRVSLFYSAVS
jgi:hypothetical protein